MALSNTIVSIGTTSATVATVAGGATYLLIANAGTETIHINYGGAATVSHLPIAGSGGSWEPPHRYLVDTLRGKTITGITASGTNANIHVWQD